jgi:AmiR/NasT family two-component response regulator
MLPEEDLVAARALADVATIGILQERALRESNILRDQLQNALNSRIVIEQAKGVVAHTRGVSMEHAFDLIRAYSRNNHVPLTQVATTIVQRKLTL